MSRASFVPSVLLALGFVLLGGCGGGEGSTSGSLPQTETSPLGSVSQTRPMSELQSDALHPPQPLYTSGPNDLLYIGNAGNNSITVYPHTAQGNQAPMHVIKGSNTGITSPGQLSEDAQGNLYVLNISTNQVLTFAHGANGNTKPIRVLNVTLPPCVNCGGFAPTITAMIVDPVTGKIFVGASDTPEGSGGMLYRFPPAASGNEVPFATEYTGAVPTQFANDSTGKNIIFTNGLIGLNGWSAGVSTVFKQFSPGGGGGQGGYFADGGGGIGNGSILDDPTKKEYVNNFTRAAENMDGCPALGTPFVPAIISTFSPPMGSPPASPSPSTCTIGGQSALGDLRNMYFTNPCGNEVDVYPHDASGTVAPLRILSGPSTGLNEPVGINEGQ